MLKENRLEISVSVLFFSAISLFVVDFILKENFIYYWDYANYWYKLIDFGTVFTANPVAAKDELIHSIKYHEYNLTPVLLLLPFEMVFGDSRLSYIFSITLIYAFPAILIFSLFFKKSMENSSVAGVDRSAYLAALLCLGLSPQLWSPVFLGYPAAGGLILIVGVMLIYSRKKFETSGYSSVLFMGLLLCLCILFRRWYAYWVVGFLTGGNGS